MEKIQAKEIEWTNPTPARWQGRIGSYDIATIVHTYDGYLLISELTQDEEVHAHLGDAQFRASETLGELLNALASLNKQS